ncbi:metal-dependent transcriptional regulator [Haloarchaeobius sp. TZWWS8]|uniref:metal-dependent transcriptional regulator n=1 Tax=Haloarchaeobius sp. TZWWS8 TaxID=3446121 RepID=UPI003EB6DE5F
MSRADETGPAVDSDRTSLTPTMEDYLRHIYRLEEQGNDWVTNSMVADRLGVERATVTSMFGTLADAGLIEREKYRPVQLTDEGRRVALRVVRRHRLVETLLLESFDYSISEVDAEADVLEHHLSDRLCREIARVLDEPETDPHGDPIPDANLDVAGGEDTVPLTDVPPSENVAVQRILSQDEAVLDHLVSAGVEPSATLRVDERAPFGMVTVSVHGTGEQTSLPEAVAAKIRVRERTD